MANEENLKPLTPSKAREIGSKGGKASVKAKRERKAMKEQMQLLLSLPLKDERTRQKMAELGIDTDSIDNQMALMVSTYKQALKGNMQAVNVIREIIGERVMEVNVNKNIDDSVKALNEKLENFNG